MQRNVFLSSDPIKNTIYFKFKSSKRYIVTQLVIMHCLLFESFLSVKRIFSAIKTMCCTHHLVNVKQFTNSTCGTKKVCVTCWCTDESLAWGL